MRDASSGDKLKIALFGDLSLEEAMDLSRDRQILESDRGVKLITHLHLVWRSRMVELYLHSPICLPGLVLN
jgi:hypothetical protein